MLDDNLAAIRPGAAHRPDDLAIIERIAAYTKAFVHDNLPRCAPEHGPCHGDLHGADVLYTDAGDPGIFDFESSGAGFRALDLAVYGGSPDWMDTGREATARRERGISEFLDGYESVRELSDGERAVLGLDNAVHHNLSDGTCLAVLDGA